MAANLHVVIYRLHSALSKRESKIKNRAEFFAPFDKFSKFTFEILPTNLVVCKAAFCTFQLYITSEVNSTMRHCFFYHFLVKYNERSLVNTHSRISVLFFLRELSLLPEVQFVSAKSCHDTKYSFLVKKLVVYYQCCVLID